MVKLQEENLTLQTKLEEVEKTTTVQTMKLQEELSEVHKKLSSLPLGGTYPLVLYQQPPGIPATCDGTRSRAHKKYRGEGKIEFSIVAVVTAESV